MLNYVKGAVIHKTAHTITVLAGAVGYEVAVSPLQLAGYKVGDNIALFTHLHIRDDAHELYGFSDAASLAFFRKLLNVTGVGPKSALHIFSLGSIEDIKRAIVHGDLAFLTRVSGIGKKTAERMVVELKDKLGEMDAVPGAPGDVLADVVEALVGLGYSKSDARSAISMLEPEDDPQALLKKALQKLSR